MYGMERRGKTEPGKLGAGGDSTSLCQATSKLKSFKNEQRPNFKTTILLMF